MDAEQPTLTSLYPPRQPPSEEGRVPVVEFDPFAVAPLPARFHSSASD